MKYLSTLTLTALLSAGLGTALGQMPPLRLDPDGAAFTAREIAEKTTDPEMKWRAIRILGSLQYKPAIPLMLTALSDAHPYVRACAARALGDMSVEKAVWPLIDVLAKEKDGGVIEQASLALKRLQATEAIPALKAVANHDSIQTRIWVIQAIAEVGGRPEVPYLARYLEDRSSSVQHRAAESIDKIMGLNFGFYRTQFRGPGGGSGNPNDGDREPIRKVKLWWAENKNQPDSFWKKAPAADASDIKLDPTIPPADREKYRDLRDPRDWANPYLIVRAGEVEIISKGIEFGRQTIDVEKLPKALADLPTSAWPYGRVVAYMNQAELGTPSGSCGASSSPCTSRPSCGRGIEPPAGRTRIERRIAMRSVITWAAVVGLGSVVAGTVSAQLSPPVMLGGLTLMSNPTVAPDLKLTAGELQKARGIYEKHVEYRRALNAIFDGNVTKHQVAFYGLQAGGLAELAAVLTPEHLKRLKQICWQQGGVHALAYDGELQAALTMTPEQRVQASKLADELLNKIQDMTRAPPQGMVEKVAALRKDAVDKVYVSLTPVQQKAYKDLLGQPLQVFNGRKGGGK